MKKSWIFLLAIILLINSAGGEVRINEVMPHTNNSFEIEWVELYFNESINLVNWTIGDLKSNDSFSLNISYGFALIIDKNVSTCDDFNIPKDSCFELTTIGSGLNDASETIFLYNNIQLIDNFSWTKNIKSSGNSWSYNGSDFVQCTPTPGQANNCSSQSDNSSNNQTNSTNNNPEISLSIDWDEDDIVNGEEFDIEIRAENLENKEYDVRVWIEFEENDTIISDRYGEDTNGEDKWLSGKYWIYNIFKGSGNKTEEIRLRIRDNYRDFYGDAKIFFKIRDEKEIEKTIKILEKENEESRENEEANKKTDAGNAETKSASSIAGSVIRLGSSEFSEKAETGDKIYENPGTIYKSKNERTKLYSVFGFALLCVGFAVLVIFHKIK